MLYTPDLLIHVQRVMWNVRVICKDLSLSPEFVNETLLEAEYHDDDEIIADDILTPVKDLWSEEERSEYEENCRNARKLLITRYWEELWDHYARILTSMKKSEVEKTSDEKLSNAIVDYADKLDAHMEVTHEIHAWSVNFWKNMKKNHWYDDHVFWYTLSKIRVRKEKIETILWKTINIWLLDINNRWDIDIHSILKNWKPHTFNSLQEKTSDTIYNKWIENHFSFGNEEQIKRLYIQNRTDLPK